MADLLNIGTTGLLNYRGRANLVEKNISNVNTENYHRQTVHQLPEMERGVRPLERRLLHGNGVNSSNVSRAYDEFLEKEYLYSAELYQYSQTVTGYTKELDSSLNTLGSGINASIQNVFEFMSNLEQEPSEDSLRYSLFSETRVTINSLR